MPLIVAASPTEANALRVRLPAGRIHCIGVGKVAAALSAQRLILEQKARALLLVGTAGGIAPWLEPLDVVIASASVQWDVDLTAVNGGECGQLNDGRRFFTTDPQAQLLAEQAASLLGYRTTGEASRPAITSWPIARSPNGFVPHSMPMRWMWKLPQWRRPRMTWEFPFLPCGSYPTKPVSPRPRVTGLWRILPPPGRPESAKRWHSLGRPTWTMSRAVWRARD